jgi:riboflavin synthase
MLTGIVQELGTVCSVRLGALTIDVSAAFHIQIELEGSVSVNGVGLSVHELPTDAFMADLSKEEGCLFKGQDVNLEPPISPDQGLDSRRMLEYVAALGWLQPMYQESTGWPSIVESPSQYRRFVVGKGSLAVEGIRLTPYDLNGDSFRYAIFPDTCESRGPKDCRQRYFVNLEFDNSAKHVERMIRFVHSD